MGNSDKQFKDYRHKEQKFFKNLIAVQIQVANCLGPSFSGTFDSTPLSESNMATWDVKTTLIFLINRFSQIQSDIYQKEVKDIANTTVNVQVVDSVRQFGDPKVTAKEIIDRTKLWNKTDAVIRANKKDYTFKPNVQ
eukprot:TRINITY_DN14843_c0_g1_i1.p1 TRINITY_DN14843_c0_g1~~TRINITY_DN14843_c0_g1_i1.p1  ORF type:complete len:137 (-),score=18.00 TRINITY_DN14843_c0_g1_i1:78-488(-)